jgi:hypothetical protein
MGNSTRSLLQDTLNPYQAVISLTIGKDYRSVRLLLSSFGSLLNAELFCLGLGSSGLAPFEGGKVFE